MAQSSLVLCCFDTLAKVFINRVGICHIGFHLTALGALVGFYNGSIFYHLFKKFTGLVLYRCCGIEEPSL